ncbi:MAPEG family protein [Variovorax sp. PAMC28562]|uniref:MAPEG family protein n=1 Tax=Variovorax sp. PAMC28562 TaxID=2762323 RepID=UPI0021C25EAF|nr:MAPEG family protein [Variovorax sp. PAMC28562]
MSAFVLTSFIAWSLILLVLMEALRTRLVMQRAVAANEFRPDNSNLSPFMQRLSRAHANCLEGIPVFGGLLLIALATNRTSVTDGLAPWFLIARVFQSSVHLSSLSVPAVNARFLAFLAQIGIGAYWVWALLVA